MTSVTTSSTSAMTNRIFAMRAVAAETPEKPKKPAMIEITKKYEGPAQHRVLLTNVGCRTG